MLPRLGAAPMNLVWRERRLALKLDGSANEFR